jgi:hypothetical protein
MIAIPLLRALRSLFHPAILLMVILPFMGALIVWIGLLMAFWNPWSRALASAVHLNQVAGMLTAWHLDWLATGSTTLLLLALAGMATLLTALVIVALIAMPMMVRLVSRQEYADLVPARGGTLAGSLVNVVTSTLVYVPVWLISLAFWLLPPIGQLLSLCATGWLNARLFRYDALAEHASKEEYRTIKHQADGRFFALGVIVAALQWVPVVNLVAPIYAGLVFVHASLLELRRVRAANFRAPPTTVLRPRARK